MESLSKILAVIDPDDPEQKALSRAIELAEKVDASVTAILVTFDFSYELTTMLSNDEREAMRETMLSSSSDWLELLINEERFTTDTAVEMQVHWHNRPYECLIQQAIFGKFDLIVKGTTQHDVLKSVIFTPTDWHLLRKAPMSVLLVKDHDWPEQGNILAAINVGADDEEHRTLNHSITQTALDMSVILKANTQFVNAYPAAPVNIAIEIPEFDPQGYNNSVKDFHINAMAKHAEMYAINGEHCHIEAGLPEDVIPNIAKAIDAELVVIGTVGRVGISAALIGNTAEHVIDMLNCDILAIKPKGFTSPITP